MIGVIFVKGFFCKFETFRNILRFKNGISDEKNLVA